MKYTTVKNLQHTEHDSIDMLVTFEGIGEVPFTASKDDKEAHGKELYARAMKGDFGEIAPVPVKTQVEIEAEAKQATDAKIEAETARASAVIAPLQDAAELDMATADEQTALIAWKRYRVFMSRVATQSGYPLTVDWPTAPDNETAA